MNSTVAFQISLYEKYDYKKFSYGGLVLSPFVAALDTTAEAVMCAEIALRKLTSSFISLGNTLFGDEKKSRTESMASTLKDFAEAGAALVCLPIRVAAAPIRFPILLGRINFANADKPACFNTPDINCLKKIPDWQKNLYESFDYKQFSIDKCLVSVPVTALDISLSLLKRPAMALEALAKTVQYLFFAIIGNGSRWEAAERALNSFVWACGSAANTPISIVAAPFQFALTILNNNFFSSKKAESFQF